MNTEALNERERIKALIERKLQAMLKEKKWKGRGTIHLSRLKKFENDLIFLIDNPDYVSIKKDVVEDNIEI